MIDIESEMSGLSQNNITLFAVLGDVLVSNKHCTEVAKGNFTSRE